MQERTYRLTLTALMTAILCIVSPWTVPLGAVPISLSGFIISLSVILLGKKYSSICVILYLLLGIAGMPVFAGFMAGAGVLLGPTGGYLMGYLPFAWTAGFLGEYAGQGITPSGDRRKREIGIAAAFLAAQFILYGMGTLWLMVQMKINLKTAFIIGVLPFLLPDLLKLSLAVSVGRAIKRRIGVKIF